MHELFHLLEQFSLYDQVTKSLLMRESISRAQWASTTAPCYGCPGSSPEYYTNVSKKNLRQWMLQVKNTEVKKKSLQTSETEKIKFQYLVGFRFLSSSGGGGSFRRIRRRSAYDGCVSNQKNLFINTGRSKITETISRQSQNCIEAKALWIIP